MSASPIEWGRVPSVCRRIAAVFAVACLGVGLPAAHAFAQDAGDQQYSDPFGGSTTTTKSKPKSGKQKTTTNPDQNLAPLSPSPQTSGQGGSSNGTSNASTSHTSTTPSAAGATSQAGLPNTGVDARLLLVVGAVLLLTGLGLRLRTTPERF
jgi:hypothetical protein